MVRLHGCCLCTVPDPHTLEKQDEQACQVRTVGNHGRGAIVRES